MHGENTVICQVRTSRAAVEDVDEDEDEDGEATEEGAEAPAAETPAES
jgi:large subunit ribosomal protein L25